MNREIPGRTFFISAYLLLAFGFLTIHFTRVENFSTVIGGLVVKGRSSVGTALSPPQIRMMKVGFNGLEVTLRKRNKLVLITDDGIRHHLGISGWQTDENSVRINLEQGAGLIFKTDPHSSSVSLSPVVPSTSPPVRSMELPFRAQNGVSLGIPNDRPGILSVSADDMEFVAKLPSGSNWIPERRVLELMVLDKANLVLEVSDDGRGGGLEVNQWLAQGNAISEAVYNSAVFAWLEAARTGWRSRIDPRTGLWTDETGKTGWSDVRAASMLADSVSRGVLPAQLQAVLSVAERAQQIGWLPSPYLGNVVAQSAALSRKITADADRLRQQLNSTSVDFGFPDALSTLVDAGYPGDATKLVNSARQIPSEGLKADQALSRLQLLQNADSDAALRRRLIDTFILPRVLWVKDGLWLFDEDGVIDMQESIRAGVLLDREARMNNDSLYQSAGRQLVFSALNYADEAGILPARLLFEGSGEVLKEGDIAPEQVYQEIAAPASYPRRLSLANEMGSGSWALSCAQRFTLRSTPRETTISVDFPAGATHHLVLKGVKNFTQLYMNGIRWNGDPNFQRYYAGWYYNETNETLVYQASP